MTPTPSNPDLAAALPEADLLPICPVCGYSLHLQPIQHRCPECGFEFDRRWQIFGGRYISNTARAHTRVVLIGFAVITVCEFAVFAILPGVPRFLLPMMLIPVIVPVAIFVAINARARRRFLVVASDGLRVFTGPQCVKLVLWNEIKTVRLDPRRRAIVATGPMGDRPICGRGPFGMHVVDIDRCVHAINSYPRPASLISPPPAATAMSIRPSVPP